MLDLVDVRSVMTGGVAARGAWTSGGTLEDPVKFFAMVSGRARLETEGAEPIELAAGDVAVLVDRPWLRLEGAETGDASTVYVAPSDDFSPSYFAAAEPSDDVIIGGCIQLNDAGHALLTRALPPLTHLRGTDAAGCSMRGSLGRLFEELRSPRPGSEFAIRQHAQLLMLELLRTYLHQADLPPGWLQLVTDSRLQPALTLMHAEPGRPWGLPELASAAAMSRTSFATYFRDVAGVPPLTYLSRWRMLLAQRALRDGNVRVGDLAAELGYGSESAFSTAFKRVVGESPLRYRARVVAMSRARVGA